MPQQQYFFVTLFLTDEPPGYVMRGHTANDPDNLKFTRESAVLKDCASLTEAEKVANEMRAIADHLVASGVRADALVDLRDEIAGRWEFEHHARFID